ncbi:hypothetical protein [Streptomyces sp. NBC_00212]|uniref:hypothetical protein n=1 Tax=Streptomyces sp. NBC_00212 TaxID=2975684 RepID=UPI00325351EF
MARAGQPQSVIVDGSYSLGAAEDREKELKAKGAAVRIVGVPVGGQVPEAVLEEMRAGGSSAAA